MRTKVTAVLLGLAAVVVLVNSPSTASGDSVQASDVTPDNRGRY